MLEAVIDGISLGFCNKKDIVCIFLSRYTDTAVHLSVARITTRTVPKVDFLQKRNLVVCGHVYPGILCRLKNKLMRNTYFFFGRGKKFWLFENHDEA